VQIKQVYVVTAGFPRGLPHFRVEKIIVVPDANTPTAECKRL